jgi:superoxide dismutase, Cu-Zn family
MKSLIAAFAGALLLASCASMGEKSGPSAVANVKPTQGNKAAGTVTFTQLGDQVRVVANISGLSPGLHGFHVHDKGDCSAPDAMSAGGHFNPSGKSHGDVNTPERHAGDLGNITADSDGNARLDVSVWGLSFTQGASNNVIGRSVVVHANPDDLKSQPAGNSGPRVACGVVGAAAPPAKSEPSGSSYRY